MLAVGHGVLSVGSAQAWSSPHLIPELALIHAHSCLLYKAHSLAHGIPPALGSLPLTLTP